MCSDSTKSSNVRTSGVHAEMTVRAAEAGPTQVSVRVRVGGMLSNTFLMLADGDELTAENGVDKVLLGATRGLIATPSNEGTLPGDSGGRTIAVKFTRPHDVSALGSSVVMPLGLRLATPRVGEDFDPAHPKMTITWSPTSSDAIDWFVRGPCVEGYSDRLAVDTGRIDVTLVAARDADGGLAPPCTVNIHLARQRTGTLDPAFGEGGSVVAMQERDQRVTFTP